MLFAALGVAALVLAANETFAGPGKAHGGGPAWIHSHPSVARSLQHHRRHHAGAFWTDGAGYIYGPTGDEPRLDATPPASGDVHYTYTYDVPWDAVHRFPPAATPSGRPYVSECPTQNVTVPGRDGTEHTVNIVRCY